MKHSFDIDLAEKYGIEAAVLLDNIAFWMINNKANNRNLHEGHIWVYNSTAALAELFPYMTKSKISRVLNRLESQGVLKSGNYNKSKYDRTKWYTIIEDSILQNYKLHFSNCKMENNKVQNGKLQITTPIPDSITDNKPDKKNTNTFTGHLPPEYHPEFEKFWSLYPARKGKKNGKRNAFKSWWIAVTKKGRSPDDLIANIIRLKSSYGDYPPDASTWLNGERWDDEIVITQSKGSLYGMREIE